MLDDVPDAEEDRLRKLAEAKDDVVQSLESGFDADLAQQRSFVMGGAALSAWAALLSTKANAESRGADRAAGVGVFAAHAVMHCAGSANWLLPHSERAQAEVVNRDATSAELARQADWLLKELRV